MIKIIDTQATFKACMIFWEVNIVAYTISTLSIVKGILTGTIPYTCT